MCLSREMLFWFSDVSQTHMTLDRHIHSGYEACPTLLDRQIHCLTHQTYVVHYHSSVSDQSPTIAYCRLQCTNCRSFYGDTQTSGWVSGISLWACTNQCVGVPQFEKATTNKRVRKRQASRQARQWSDDSMLGALQAVRRVNV